MHCGLCMYGCPHGLIYSSMATVEQLRENPRFEYQPGFVVDSLSETDSAVTINGRDALDGTGSTLQCERAYLAAGVIPTTQILLRSLNAFDRPVQMLDLAEYFLIPLATSKNCGDVLGERLHTLSQLFLEMHDPAISPYTVHLQLYTYNDLIGSAVRNAFGPLASPLQPLARGLARRLIVLQGYLHSAHSARIQMTLRQASGERPQLLEVAGEMRPESRRVVGKVLRKLLRSTRQLGAVPLTPLTKIAEPGRGFHTGGSFQRVTRPARSECDVLGRPSGWQRVHAVRFDGAAEYSGHHHHVYGDGQCPSHRMGVGPNL